MLSPAVRSILSQQSHLHHRNPAFKTIFKSCQLGLQKVFQTEEPVLILTCSGTGAMEAALTNCLSPKQEVLCLSAGKFGERWLEMASSFQLKVHSLRAAYGETIQPLELEKALKNHPSIRAVLATACETSTATEHPIKAFARILKNWPKTLFIVDAISALGSMPLKMDRWGIDVMVAGSQKRP